MSDEIDKFVDLIMQLKTSWEEIISRKSCEICSHYQYDENEDMCVAACLKEHNVADGVCEDWELMTFR